MEKMNSHLEPEPGFNSFKSEVIESFRLDHPFDQNSEIEKASFELLLKDFEDSLPEKYKKLQEQLSVIQPTFSEEKNEVYIDSLKKEANNVVNSGLAIPKEKNQFMIREGEKLILYKVEYVEEKYSTSESYSVEVGTRSSPKTESRTRNVTRIKEVPGLVEKVKEVTVAELKENYGLSSEDLYKYLTKK